jgi:hypothetical protein
MISATSNFPAMMHVMIVPLASLFVLWLAIFVWSLIRARRGVRRYEEHQRHRQGLCPTCGYNLTGNTSGTCPECGTVVTA